MPVFSIEKCYAITGRRISRAVEKREWVSTQQHVCERERESGIECGRSLDDDRWPVNGNDMEM